MFGDLWQDVVVPTFTPELSAEVLWQQLTADSDEGELDADGTDPDEDYQTSSECSKTKLLKASDVQVPVARIFFGAWRTPARTVASRRVCSRLPDAFRSFHGACAIRKRIILVP